MKTHIAILGGAFNPIRLGHIDTAELVLKRLPDIDEVWIAPTYKHTFNKDMLSPKHRVKMCELAITNKRIKTFSYEIDKKLQNGTLEFIMHLENNKRYRDYVFYFVIGMDNANQIYKWRNWEQLIKIGKFIVINRPGVERDETQNWYLKYPHIFLKNQTGADISSTSVRTLLDYYYTTKDDTILIELKKYLNPKVLQYILKNKLYLQHEKSTKVLQ